jgi:hypothetical protein
MTKHGSSPASIPADIAAAQYLADLAIHAGRDIGSLLDGAALIVNPSPSDVDATDGASGFWARTGLRASS